MLSEEHWVWKGETEPSHAKEIMAMRGDGSTMESLERFLATSPVQVSSRTIQLANGTTIYVDDVSQKKSTVVRTNFNPGTDLRDPDSGCFNTFKGTPLVDDQLRLSGLNVLGIDTVRLSVRGVHQWFAPSLGCARLLQRVQFSPDETTEMRATRVLKGEPAAELFEVSSVYQEIPLSVLRGVPAGTDEQRRMDEYYYRNRPKG